jgi:hypothetical protein
MEPKKKLSLSKETVRILKPAEMVQVVGGAGQDSYRGCVTN